MRSLILCAGIAALGLCSIAAEGAEDAAGGGGPDPDMTRAGNGVIDSDTAVDTTATTDNLAAGSFENPNGNNTDDSDLASDLVSDTESDDAGADQELAAAEEQVDTEALAEELPSASDVVNTNQAGSDNANEEGQAEA